MHFEHGHIPNAYAGYIRRKKAATLGMFALMATLFAAAVSLGAVPIIQGKSLISLSSERAAAGSSSSSCRSACPRPWPPWLPGRDLPPQGP